MKKKVYIQSHSSFLHEVQSPITRAKLFIQKSGKATHQYFFLDCGELVLPFLISGKQATSKFLVNVDIELTANENVIR